MTERKKPTPTQLKRAIKEFVELGHGDDTTNLLIKIKETHPEWIIEELGDFSQLCLRVKKEFEKRELKEQPKEEIQKEKFDEETLSKAKKILREGNPLEFIVQTINKVHIGDKPSIVACVLSRTSLFLKKTKQLHLQAIARSGKGKSSLIKKFMLGLPRQKIVKLDSLSAKTIEYASEKKDLNGYLFYCDEAEVTTEATPVLRALTDRLDYDGTTDNIKSWTVREQEHLELNITGRQLVWLSSLEPVKDLQLVNRLFLIKTDESLEQDDRVFKHQKKEEGYGVKVIPEEMKIMRAIYTIVEENDDEVFVPYVDLIEWGFKRNRRDFPLFMSFLKASAKIFKFQRETLEDGRIIANRVDFEIAKHIWLEMKELQSKKISQEGQKILEILPTESQNAMTRATITDLIGWSTGKIQQYLDYNLCTADSNLVAKDNNDKGRVIYWKLTENSLLSPIIQVDWSSFGIKELKAILSTTYWKIVDKK